MPTIEVPKEKWSGKVREITLGATAADGGTLAPKRKQGKGFFGKMLPARSSAFRDMAPYRLRLPLWRPQDCTGCGSCWAQCPESALRHRHD